MSESVRFRADPKLVRVSIRREDDGSWHHARSWRATVTERGVGRAAVHAWAQDPVQAVMAALRKADKHDFPGIDLGMDWAYDHPWK